MFPKIQALARFSTFFREAPTMRRATFALLLAASMAFAAGVRLHQMGYWYEARESHFVGDIPMMTTVDAYYWLRWAREYTEGTFQEGGEDGLRNYPDGLMRDNPVKPHSVFLSRMIAAVSDLTGVNVYLAGLYLVPLLSILFVIPLALYAYRIGFPLAGLLGGVLASVSFEYYIRTSVGRVDTDCLNLFFMCLIPYFILLTEKRDDAGVIAFASLAGFSTFLFGWWYDITSFMGVFFVILLMKLALNRTPILTTVVAAFFFIVFCDPDLFMGTFFSLKILFLRLFPEQAVTTAAATSTGSSAPDAMQTITELERFGFEKTLGLILDNPRFVAAGLALCLLMFATNPDKLLPLMPLFALGLFAFFKGRRFAMYLSPFVGIGWGYGVTLAILLASKSFFRPAPAPKKRNKKQTTEPDPGPRRIWIEVSLVLAGLAIFLIAWPYTAISYVPGSKIDAKIYANLLKLKDVLPTHARVLNYWNFGYLIADTVRRPTYSDGGMPGSVKTYYVSHAYSSTSPRELYNIASYIDRNGEAGLWKAAENRPNFADAVRSVAEDATPPPDDGIHVAFTSNMIDQFPSINFLGAWNFEKNVGDRQGYNVLECGGINQGIIACKEGTFDINKGTLDGKPALAMTVAVENGREKQRIPVREQGYVLELLLENGRIRSVLLMTARGFNSNFNQMYILGRYDAALFEPVYDAFPALRVYRMKKPPAS